jgi:uncharacterized protein YbjT (DUF2867 family)
MGERTILITGGTGRQGGAVARELLNTGFRLRAMTRKPDGDAGRALAAAGVEVVGGDLDNEASLDAPLSGAWGVFSVQNTWEAGVEREEAQGIRLAKAARRAGVQHFVYTSVGSAHRQTGIPHFENKWRIEQTVRALAFPSHVIIRPVFFMENLLTPWFLNGDTIYAGMKPTTRLQMIAVEDIGRLGARAFIDADRLNRREIDLAGDAKTMPEVAAILSRAFRRPITFVEIPLSEVRKNSEDFASMLEWFERVGYDADIAGVAKEFGFTPLTLDAWAAKQSGTGGPL